MSENSFKDRIRQAMTTGFTSTGNKEETLKMDTLNLMVDEVYDRIIKTNRHSKSPPPRKGDYLVFFNQYLDEGFDIMEWNGHCFDDGDGEVHYNWTHWGHIPPIPDDIEEGK